MGSNCKILTILKGDNDKVYVFFKLVECRLHVSKNL